MWLFLTASVVGVVAIVSGSLIFTNSLLKQMSPEDKIKLKETEARIQKEKEERERIEKEAYDEKIRKDEEAEEEARKTRAANFLKGYPDDASFCEARKYIAFLALKADDLITKDKDKSRERTILLSLERAWLVFDKYNKIHPELMTCFTSYRSEGREYIHLPSISRPDLEDWAKWNGFRKI